MTQAQADAKYLATNRGRAARRASVARWKEQHPERARAHQLVYNARRRGEIVRTPCAVCGDPKVHAHHPNGYEGASALDIVWLCRRDHTAAHKEASRDG